jgi:uncharacterized membrane protein
VPFWFFVQAVANEGAETKWYAKLKDVAVTDIAFLVTTNFAMAASAPAEPVAP